MSFVWVLALTAATAAGVTPEELESATSARLNESFERKGRTLPSSDPSLNQAARILANRALTQRAADVVDLLSLSDALSGAGGADPSPRALVLRANPAGELFDVVQKRADFADDPSTHRGIAAAVSGDQGAIVVLLAERKARLQPFPRTFPKAGAAQHFCGETAQPLAAPDVFITRPAGDVVKVPLSRSAGESFCAPLTFPVDGRYTVETVSKGPRGPEVTSLFFVDVGPASKRSLFSATVEPTTLEPARAQVLERINALRTAQGLSRLAVDPALDRVAQQYSDRMAAQGFFAHVSPEGEDVRARLKAQGYAYRTAGENLGLAGGPLAAHFGIEHSPGHRKNLLEPAFTHAGVGITWHRVGDRNDVIVTELFSVPQSVSLDPVGDAYRALDAQRARLKLQPLRRTEKLEQIAGAHARKALSDGIPKSQLPSGSVHDQVFAATDFQSVSVDVFVAESLAPLTDSGNAKDARSDRIGIGFARGDSVAWGKDKYWVVVIYAASH